jgi:DNA-binding transcriptional LysR family regulator
MPNHRYELPPLDMLRGFEAAARTLSFTKAGEELFLTQSAVSRQIKALEDSLGVPLFERRPRALVLTEAGERLLRVVTDALERLDEVTRELKSGRESTDLTVTTTAGFASLWLIPRLARFTREHPGVDVRISTSNGMVDLARGRVDLAIRYCRPEVAPAGSPRLFGEAMLPVCAPALADGSGPGLKVPADLARHVLLHFDYDGPRGGFMDWSTWLAVQGLEDLKPAGSVRFNQYEQLIQAAASGQGVALGSKHLVDGLIRSGSLIAPFGTAITGERAYYVVTAPSAAAKSQVADFTAWLVEEAGAE